jgi:hypothetical protein
MKSPYFQLLFYEVKAHKRDIERYFALAHGIKPVFFGFCPSLFIRGAD